MSVADTVAELLRPVVATLGVELIDVEWIGASLRVIVDEPGGISTDQLASVNRIISPLLDQHDPVPGRYTLEVSSPGVERKLTRPDHFVRAIGEGVIVKLNAGVEPRRLKGTLTAFDGDVLTVDATEIDGVDLPGAESHGVALVDVAKARTFFDWGPSPKPGGKGAPAKKKSTTAPSTTSSRQSEAPRHE